MNIAASLQGNSTRANNLFHSTIEAVRIIRPNVRWFQTDMKEAMVVRGVTYPWWPLHDHRRVVEDVCDAYDHEDIGEDHQLAFLTPSAPPWQVYYAIVPKNLS